MTFGLCNAPATMQTMMDDLMYELYQKGKIVHYIDDIIIGGENKHDLRDTTIQVLRKLKDNDLFANSEKFEYDVPEVNILGALVSHGQI
jgi:Tfp pilus assembly ATPase PilU